MTDRIKISESTRNEIKKLMVPYVHEAADRIATACNQQSSWGFYAAEKSEYGAAVVTLVHEAAVDNARAQRILRNLKAGGV